WNTLIPLSQEVTELLHSFPPQLGLLSEASVAHSEPQSKNTEGKVREKQLVVLNDVFCEWHDETCCLSSSCQDLTHPFGQYVQSGGWSPSGHFVAITLIRLALTVPQYLCSGDACFT
ncbi:hypothetical protein H1C71_041936, partial [Ictidomys tridecemlineatus]